MKHSTKKSEGGKRYRILDSELGRKLSTKEVAAYVGLDEDTVRKHYESIGGIRPTGPTGRILFFEKNIMGALRRNTHAFEDKQEWTNSLEGQSSEGRRGDKLTEGQDQLMLLSYLHLAARRAELFRLTWSDVDFLNYRVRLGTCKRKDGTLEYDWLPMTRELKTALMKWWEERPIKDIEHVFVCTEETPFCREYYGKPFQKRQHLMKRLCKRAGVKLFGLHAIRHLTASVLYQAGQPVALIQAILRHKSPSTTERYLRSLGLEHTREALDGVFEGRRQGKVIPFTKKEAPKVAASGASYFQPVLPPALAMADRL